VDAEVLDLGVRRNVNWVVRWYGWIWGHQLFGERHLREGTPFLAILAAARLVELTISDMQRDLALCREVEKFLHTKRQSVK
jgi:hypothetical protein